MNSARPSIGKIEREIMNEKKNENGREFLD